MLHNIFLLILLLSIFGLILSQSYDQDEIKSLKCDVCLNLVDNFIKLSDDARENAPYKKLSELQVVEIIEDICENTSKYGKWIREFIVTPTQGDDNKTYLTIEKQPSLSRCKKDCNVITATCKKILGSLDIDDLSAVAYKRLNLEKAQVILFYFNYILSIIIFNNILSFLFIYRIKFVSLIQILVRKRYHLLKNLLNVHLIQFLMKILI